MVLKNCNLEHEGSDELLVDVLEGDKQPTVRLIYINNLTNKFSNVQIFKKEWVTLSSKYKLNTNA